MPRVIWTPPALRDVARLHGFLAPKNRDAARRAVRAIRQGVKTLAAHPEIGRPVDEMPPEFREWSSGSATALMSCSIGTTALRPQSWLCGTGRKPDTEPIRPTEQTTKPQR
jgi:plasmid stabilization system protein ParE